MGWPWWLFTMAGTSTASLRLDNSCNKVVDENASEIMFGTPLKQNQTYG